MNANRISIVLVEPEIPANIGFVARTMACYHRTDLRIVGSKALIASLVESDQAIKTAKGARDLLQTAKFFPSLAEAIADCHFTFGFTRRERLPSQRIMDLAEAVVLVEGNGEVTQVALVFGRESQGLNREETLLLTHLVRNPMPDETMSLNLSHAVAISLYAFYQAQDLKKADFEKMKKFAGGKECKSEAKNSIPAQNQDRLGGLQNLIGHLDQQGFYHAEKRDAQIEFTKMLWQRLQPNRKELDFILGLLKNLIPQNSGKG